MSSYLSLGHQHKGLKAGGFCVEPARITLCVGRCLPPRQACSSGRLAIPGSLGHAPSPSMTTRALRGALRGATLADVFLADVFLAGAFLAGEGVRALV